MTVHRKRHRKFARFWVQFPLKRNCVIEKNVIHFTHQSGAALCWLLALMSIFIHLLLGIHRLQRHTYFLPFGPRTCHTTFNESSEICVFVFTQDANEPKSEFSFVHTSFVT